MPSKNLILGLALLICLSSSVLAIDATLLTKGYLNDTALGSPIFIKVHATSTYGIKEVRVVIWRPFDSSRDNIADGTGDRYWDNGNWSLTNVKNNASPDPDGVTFKLNCFNLSNSTDYLNEGVIHFVGVEVEYWTNSARTLSATYNIPVETLIYDNTPPSLLSVTPLPPLSNQPRVPISTTDPASGIKTIKAYIYYKDEHGDKFYYDEATGNWSELGFFDNKYRLTSFQADTPRPGHTVNNTVVFPALTSGKRYYYNIKVTDFAGNNAYGSYYNFTYDGTLPDINISSPPAQGTTRNFVSTAGYPLILFNGNPWNIADRKIQGTASDAHSGLNKVELYISDYTISAFDTSTNSWTTALVSPKTFTPGNTFTYSLPNAFFTGVADGANIIIQANAYDQAGNKKYLEYYTFFVDNLRPTSTIATDALLSSYPTEFRGTTVDTRGPTDNISGGKSVKLKVSRTRDGITKYWGMGWTTPHNPWEIPMPFMGWVNPSAASFLDATVAPAPDVYTPVIWTYSTRSSFWTDAHPTDVYTLYAWATDNAGNTQAVATQKEIRIDTTVPFVSIKYPRNHFKADAALPWIPRFLTVTASDPASGIDKVEVRAQRNSQYFNWVTKAWDLDSSSPDVWKAETIPATSYGEYNFLLPTPPYEVVDSFYAGLADGDSFVFTVKATDKTLHVTEYESTPIIYDNTPPTNPAPLSEGVKWQNVSNAQVGFVPGSDPIPPGKAASGLLCYINQIVCPDGSTKTINSGFVLPTATSFDWTMDRGEGVYNLKVISLDWALNWASNLPSEPYKIATFQVGIDTIAPTSFNIQSPANGSTIDTLTPAVRWGASSDPTPPSGQCSGLKNYQIILDGALLTTVTGLSYEIPAGRLVNGSHTIQIVAVDNAGNETPVSTNFNVQSKIPPEISISAPEAVNTTSYAIFGSASDDSLINKIEFKVNNGLYTAIAGLVPSKSIDFSQAITLNANATNIVSFRATDDTNLTIDTTVSLICDTNPPNIRTIFPVNDGWATSTPTFRWEKSTDALSGLRDYSIIIDGVTYGPIVEETYLPTTPLSAGNHTYSVIAYDKAGNSASSRVNFKVDNTNPTAFTITDPTEGAVKGSPFTVVWTASSDNANEWDSGLVGYKIFLNNELMAEAPAGATSVLINNIPIDGNYALRVDAMDVAGNVTPSSNTVNIIADFNAPVISLYERDTLLADHQKLRSKPDLRAVINDQSGIDRATVIIYIDGQPQENTALQATETQTQGVTVFEARQSNVRLNSGKHIIKVAAKDNQGKETILEVKDLDVLGSGSIIGQVKSWPNPFSPASGQSAHINYTLGDDEDIIIRIFDLSSRLVWTKNFAAGTIDGGQIGENNPTWDGKDHAGNLVANGVYVAMIINNKGKLLGSCEIAVVNKL